MLAAAGNCVCSCGYAHVLVGSPNSVLSGGYQNSICACGSGTTQRNYIFGGTLGCIYGYTGASSDIEVSYNTITGGNSNRIVEQNTGFPVTFNSIFGGNGNRICGQSTGGKATGQLDYNTIFGGSDNQIAGSFAFNTILGGKGNLIDVAVACATVFGNSLTNSAYYTSCFGPIVKSSSTFSISHPDPVKNQTHKLIHTTVESPTAGDNIYRFEVQTQNCQAVVDLPSYYKFLNKDDQVWVSPKDHFGSAEACVNQAQTQINVTSNCDGSYYLLLIGTRKDECVSAAWDGPEHFDNMTHIVDEHLTYNK